MLEAGGSEIEMDIVMPAIDAERPNGVKKVKTYACPTCGKTFSFSCNLFRHEKNIHKKFVNCQVPGCLFKCSSKRKLIGHMELLHFKTLEKETLTFANLEEFYKWKLREEVQNFVCFTKKRGDIKMARSTHRHYVCALSRRLGFQKNTDGKKEVYCPARLLLKESHGNGTVEVTYYKSHSHPLSYSGSKNLPMPETLRHEIKERLKAGMNPDNIISELRKMHKSELAVAIGIYNRLQSVTASHISKIQRMMIKKGMLEEAIPQNKPGEMGVLRMMAEADKEGASLVDDIKQMNDGFVVFDCVVQEQMDVVNLPEESTTIPGANILIPDPVLPKPKTKRKKVRRGKNPPDVITPFIVNPEGTQKGELDSVHDSLDKVKLLLSSGQVRETDLTGIQENLQGIMKIINGKHRIM
ncbi:uncharacterized protein LOC129264384 [Lytechinus pictus]|uniref:uncharacterized protein LOC129264384 n=1 Tax=Lytechinus pictus TaxID=7653 RepID=UPI0030B9BB95